MLYYEGNVKNVNKLVCFGQYSSCSACGINGSSKSTLTLSTFVALVRSICIHHVRCISYVSWMHSTNSYAPYARVLIISRIYWNKRLLFIISWLANIKCIFCVAIFYAAVPIKDNIESVRQNTICENKKCGNLYEKEGSMIVLCICDIIYMHCMLLKFHWYFQELYVIYSQYWKVWSKRINNLWESQQNPESLQ